MEQDSREHGCLVGKVQSSYDAERVTPKTPSQQEQQQALAAIMRSLVYGVQQQSAPMADTLPIDPVVSPKIETPKDEQSDTDSGSKTSAKTSSTQGRMEQFVTAVQKDDTQKTHDDHRLIRVMGKAFVALATRSKEPIRTKSPALCSE